MFIMLPETLCESGPGFCPMALRATVNAIPVAVKAAVVAINSSHLTNTKSHSFGNVFIVMLNCNLIDKKKCQVNVFRFCLINLMA